MNTTTVDELRSNPPAAGTTCVLVGRIIKSEIGFWVIDASSKKPEFSCAVGVDDATLEDRFRASGVPALGGGPFLYSFECEFGCTILASEKSGFSIVIGQLTGLKLFRRDRGREYEVTDS